MLVRTAAVVLVVCGILCAQSNQATPTPRADPVSGPQSSQWSRLSVKEKLRYDARHLFEIDNIVFAGIGAALDQERDRPGEWGQGWGPFAERYASHLGQYAIQRSIAGAVQAMNHEDPRYFRSSRKSIRGRIGDALLHTVWRHDDSGGMMPAYSEFIGDYGAAALSRSWWPDRYHTKSEILAAGSDTILIDAGINLFHEFFPDVRRRLHLGH